MFFSYSDLESDAFQTYEKEATEYQIDGQAELANMGDPGPRRFLDCSSRTFHNQGHKNPVEHGCDDYHNMKSR